ncbi:MAG: AAA family ATPase, partial [Candidatus Omnitrophica bacterium]|nr:AAA family ATPase [Candidatus Omnitrophota bacterium]
MKLKKIYICGFKSIADPLTVAFGEGVTCIVGPNGCGKSNISDSVKWVLAEQNPRNLRANKMEDLIFGGTSARKAEGMTEVRLTIDNSDGQLQLPYTEIEIGRRLYRTGESEYRINKEIVRRKDIVDLFANTGVGTNTYSVLEQGQVDGILRAKPVDRREIFEEASGITKYRM